MEPYILEIESIKTQPEDIDVHHDDQILIQLVKRGFPDSFDPMIASLLKEEVKLDFDTYL